MYDTGHAQAPTLESDLGQGSVTRPHRRLECVPSPDLTVVPAENFFREAELNFTNVQLFLL
jgi:hypothetical protein